MNNTLPRTPRPRRARARGMTLVELMVAMLVMTVGMVGLVTLMAKASQASSSSEDNLRASLLAADLASDMWTATSTTPATLAAWQDRVANPALSGLPGAKAVVTTNGQFFATITITWTTPAGAPRQYTTDVRLN